MAEITFTDQNFEAEVLKEKGPVLVEFWASWCGPCQAMSPIIEELTKDFEDQNIKIGKLNVDENQITAQKYNVMSIPTVIFFKDGKEADKSLGLKPKDELADKIKEIIK